MSLSSRNVRRFFRINMPMHYFVTPTSAILDREIFATGSIYYPPSTRTILQQQKQNIIDSMARIQEYKDELMQIFSEMIEHADFFGQCAHMMTQGINPKNTKNYWNTLKSHQRGFVKIQLLKTEAPKTYQYLKTIENKYLFYLNHMIESLENSNSEHFYAPGLLPKDFKIDELAKAFADEKYQTIPLAQTILHTAEFIETHSHIFREIYDEHNILQHPDTWPEETVNVSASGLAIVTRKSFKMHERVTIRFYFSHHERILVFTGVVVNIQPTTNDQGEAAERIAMNFEFPNGKDQAYLQTQIQKYEIDQCRNI